MSLAGDATTLLPTKRLEVAAGWTPTATAVAVSMRCRAVSTRCSCMCPFNGTVHNCHRMTIVAIMCDQCPSLSGAIGNCLVWCQLHQYAYVRNRHNTAGHNVRDGQARSALSAPSNLFSTKLEFPNNCSVSATSAVCRRVWASFRNHCISRG